MVSQLASQGMAPVGSQPDEWLAYLKSEFARWSKVIKEAGIAPSRISRATPP